MYLIFNYFGNWNNFNFTFYMILYKYFQIIILLHHKVQDNQYLNKNKIKDQEHQRGQDHLEEDKKEDLDHTEDQDHKEDQEIIVDQIQEIDKLEMIKENALNVIRKDI